MQIAPNRPACEQVYLKSQRCYFLGLEVQQVGQQCQAQQYMSLPLGSLLALLRLHQKPAESAPDSVPQIYSLQATTTLGPQQWDTMVLLL